MKLLVFAHKPPPHHGQSYMVELLLKVLGGDMLRGGGAESAARRGQGEDAIACYHVDARYSTEIEQMGKARWSKLFLALKYGWQALWCRLRHGVTHFYYVPADSKRVAIYRDWLVLGPCRLIFKKVVLHWHAAGLGQWFAQEATAWERWISRWVYFGADLSIVLRSFNRSDGLQFRSQRIEVVPNGIPDPCRRFDEEVLPRRQARAAARQKALAGKQIHGLPSAGGAATVFRALFVGLCYREKGLFDTVEAVALVNQKLTRSRLRVRLAVAGTFWLDSEREEFMARIRQADLLDDDEQPVVEYYGFVSGEAKHRLFCESDCVCFPTYMAESFGLVLVEALAFGLPVIATDWRDIPELLPPNYPHIVPPRSPERIAEHLLALAGADFDGSLRPHFLEHYTEEKFAANIRKALLSV